MIPMCLVWLVSRRFFHLILLPHFFFLGFFISAYDLCRSKYTLRFPVAMWHPRPPLPPSMTNIGKSME